MKKGILIVAAGLMIGVPVPLRLAAQQTPLVLVHGLKSDSSTWRDTPQYLTQRLALTTMQYNTSSFHFYQDQAEELKGKIGNPGATLIAVGHSNGGIVSRMMTLNTGSPAKPLQGIVTIGTPHSGAPLVTSVLEGYATNWVQDWVLGILDAPWFYAQFYDLCGYEICSWISSQMNNAWNGVLWFFNEIGFALDWAVGWSIQRIRDESVFGQMEPASYFQGQVLNSAGNLAREAAVIPVRSSIVSEGDPLLTSLWLAASPGSAVQNTGWQYFVMGVYDVLYFYYGSYDSIEDPDTFVKRSNAYRWYNGFHELASTDYDWCNLLGGWDDSYNPFPMCRSDGVVPATSQAWPGGRQPIIVPNGPGHTAETYGLQETLHQALRNEGFSIGNSSSAFNAGIIGPADVWERVYCSWSAGVSGGTPPYSYSWRLNGTPVGSNSYYTLRSGSAGFELSLIVTDNTGRIATTYQVVNVNPEAPGACG